MTKSQRTNESAGHPLHAIARRLAEALDRAVQRNMHAHAERLARAAARLTVFSSRLADRLARLRLAQRRPDEALAIIEARSGMPASLRLLRATCLIALGRTVEAHFDLLEWSRKSTAPLAARRLLALLELASGDEHAAVDALTRNLQHADDPATLAILITISAEQARPEQAMMWALRLRAASIVNPGAVDVDLLCESLALPRQSDAAQVNAPLRSQVESLAVEIIAQPEAIGSLVIAREQQRDAAATRLVHDSLERALPQLEDHAGAHEALARLALALGRREAAIRWCRRGLDLNPMSAPLTMLLRRLEAEQRDDAADERLDVLATLTPADRRRAA